MNRKTLLRPLALGHSPCQIEALECRQMLASDLLMTNYDDSNGTAVYRYNETTWTPTTGSVPTGDNGVGVSQGLAVAPDGSFFVSSAGSLPPSVLHFDVNGDYLGVLGAGDAVPAPIYFPGTLKFGPDGDLYVADLGSSSILQFDLTSVGQTWQPAGSHFFDYTPAGFTFADDISHDLIVGSLSTQAVTRYHSDNSSTLLINPLDGYNIFPTSIITAGADLLIADTDLGGEPTGHHRIVKWSGTDYTDATITTFINLTTPVGTGPTAGYAPQATAMLYDHDGNLLVAVSPDHQFNGVVRKYDIDDGSQIGGDLISGTGSVTGLAFIPSLSSEVVGRHLFYNESFFDGTSAAINASDDNAIATDKTAYVADGSLAQFSAVSSYSRGINGIMIDLAGGGDHASISANDFVFKTGNDNSPGGWATVTATPTISVRAGAGVSGSDRVEITWASNSIRNTWLEVEVLANNKTGLTDADFFYWGNKIGDVGTSTPPTTFLTSGIDKTVVLGSLGGPNLPVTNTRDFNRDGNVTGIDATIVLGSLGSIQRLQLGVVVMAVQGESGDAGIASALATSTAFAGPAAFAAPTALMPATSPAAVAAAVAQLADAPTTSTLGSLVDAAVDELDDDLVADVLAGLAA
jgi:hypothetical protein